MNNSLIRYSWLRRYATDPLPDEDILVKAAYACIVNSVCHYLFQMVLVKITHVRVNTGGRRKWTFAVSSGYAAGLQLAFDVIKDGSRVVRYHTGKSGHADIEKVYRWAVGIAGPPPPGLLDRIAASNRPRRPGRWRRILRVILWPLAVKVSMEEDSFSLRWTWRRLLILLIAVSLLAANIINNETDSPALAFGMLIATFFLTIFLVLTRHWHPRGYYSALRDIYKNITECQGYIREYEKTGNPALPDKVESRCLRAHPDFQETLKHHTFPGRIEKFYQLLLSYFFIWARLNIVKGEDRSEIVFEDIILNRASQDAISWLTFWMDQKKLLYTTPENFPAPLNSPGTYRRMIDDLIGEIGETIAEMRKKYGANYNGITGK